MIERINISKVLTSVPLRKSTHISTNHLGTSANLEGSSAGLSFQTLKMLNFFFFLSGKTEKEREKERDTSE